ncbi:MAG: glycosyltransferase family 2 protein [Vampirovibrio sp.]|nr:glycosyltransferase family 2 protein [Vampirovibrio sp.]
MNISIIIPTYQRPELIERLCEQVLVQELPNGIAPLNIAVYIVDDDDAGNVSKSVETLAKKIPAGSPYSFTYVLGEGLGPGQARNKAVTESKCNDDDWVIFLDDDCEVGKKWLSEFIEGISKRPGAEMYYGPVTSGAQPCPPFLHALDIQESPYKGANIAFKAKAYKALGGFEEPLSYWAEDWDLVAKAQKAEVKLNYLPHWQCGHPARYTSPRYLYWPRIQQHFTTVAHMLEAYPQLNEVQKHFSSFFRQAPLMLGIRLLFWLLPALVVSPGRVFLVFMLLNISFDAIRLIRKQMHLKAHRYRVRGVDAILYLLLNWTEDLWTAIQRLWVLGYTQKLKLAK